MIERKEGVLTVTFFTWWSLFLSMIDNINKLSARIDGAKQQQQQTAASLVNLTDDGEILVIRIFYL